MSMATKNLSKSFKGKLTGQRLPPIPIANEQLPTPSEELPTSILKQSKSFIEDVTTDDRTIPFDDDEPESSRIIFQKSREEVILLLETYPPKTYKVPKCLQTNYDNSFIQGRTPNSIFETLLSSNDQQHDFIEPFPPPLSDRMPSSRYCRRSVSSACSRRSSILFPRHSTIPVDSTQQLRREDTFDTVCESFSENIRSSYTPLPPIPTDPSANLSKSLTVPSADPLPSISPPLITTEETPDIQEKKDEFTRRLLSKSLHREPIVSSTDKTMDSPILVHKASIVKCGVTPRLQKPLVENRRVNSVERHVPAPPVKTKLPTACSPTSINTNPHRLGKFSLDIFQPQPKSNTVAPTTNKKPAIVTNKPKAPTKLNAPKVKMNEAISDEETVQTKNDVIPPPSPVSVYNETPQLTTTITTETVPPLIVTVEPVCPPVEQAKIIVPAPLKRHSSSSSSSQRHSHPVPKPLTLQGEKTFDTDYPQPIHRPVASAMMGCQRRGSLKGQPVITELFEDTSIETAKPVVKPEPVSTTNTSTFRVKKERPRFLKSAKPKKPIVANKPKASSAVTTKAEMKCQSTNTEINEEKRANETSFVVGGTNWMMTVKPQMMKPEESILSHLSEAETVDDEDIPFCSSPTDQLESSQTTLMTSCGDIVRRNSIESIQAMEISPVLTQTIEHPIEPTSQVSKLNEPSLMNSDIRTVYETLQDSIRKDSSFRSIPLTSKEEDVASVKPSIPLSTTSTSSHNKTLPFEANVSVTHTYNNSDTGLSIRPPLRVVNDSLNSRGSETIDSNSSHEDYSATPLCAESDCDEVYRTARKGRQVGKGAYGTVWSHLTVTGRVIAVKEIELDEGDSERVRNDYESVREEIHILRALNHPYVVKFLGITLENARLVKIFMEYLPNGTIEHLITSFGPFHNDVLKKYTQQIVEGVAYLHTNNVVHRDIKGKNVMLDVDGNIKLIDFGCAKRLKNNQNTHSMRQLLKSMKGTANWMAPEVIAETGHGKKADIWSIGCTLCEMATGKPPWSSEHNHLAVLLIIANGTKPPADLPDTCPVSAQEFFRLCLTRDPRARPSAKDLLNHPFIASGK